MNHLIFTMAAGHAGYACPEARWDNTIERFGLVLYNVAREAVFATKSFPAQTKVIRMYKG